MRTENKDEFILIKNDITYKFIKFENQDNSLDKSAIDKSAIYLCTYWSSNLGSDPNNFFGREFTQAEYDNLTGKSEKSTNQKKLTKTEKEKLKREKEIEETRKAMGLST